MFKARVMLAIAHQNRYQLTGSTADSTQALNYLHMALENPCGLNTDIAAAYLRHMCAYMQKLDCDGDSSVLNPSLESHIQGIQLIPMDDPQRPIALHGLTYRYQRRYQLTRRSSSNLTQYWKRYVIRRVQSIHTHLDMSWFMQMSNQKSPKIPVTYWSLMKRHHFCKMQ